jgi:hypothetical protein
MTTPMQKVITTGLSGGNPFRNIKQPNVSHNGEAQAPFRSTVVTTISGRTVFKPLPNK